MSAGPWSIGAIQEVGRTALYNQPLNCKNELQQQTLDIAHVISYSTCKYFASNKFCTHWFFKRFSSFFSSKLYLFLRIVAYIVQSEVILATFKIN